MKVLKKGSETDWAKQLRCKGSGLGGTAGCGAVLLVSPGDVKSETLCHFDDYETVYWFVCPECGVRTSVRENEFVSRSRTRKGGVS